MCKRIVQLSLFTVYVVSIQPVFDATEPSCSGESYTVGVDPSIYEIVYTFLNHGRDKLFTHALIPYISKVKPFMYGVGARYLRLVIEPYYCIDIKGIEQFSWFFHPMHVFWRHHNYYTTTLEEDWWTRVSSTSRADTPGA